MAAPAPTAPTAYAVRDEIDGSLLHHGFGTEGEARAFADPRNARRQPEQPPYRVYALVPVQDVTLPGQLARMFGAAADHELAILDEVAERAGLIWRCRDPAPGSDDEGCGTTNDEGADRCRRCGAPGPAAA